MDPGSGATFHRQLTRRQAECVALLDKGLSSKEIARELGISPSTVDNHIAAVMHQLNLPNRSAITRFVGLQQGISPEITSDKFDFGRDVHSKIEPKADKGLHVNLCVYCQLKAYFKNTFLPSLIFALQCSIFLIMFLLGLRYFVKIGL